jgi:hypothetical protein
VDTLAPRLEVLIPKEGAPATGKVVVKVRAGDDGAGVTVLARLAGKKDRKLKPFKGEKGVFRIVLDTKDWPKTECFLWIVARDEAGNETHRVVRFASRE